MILGLSKEADLQSLESKLVDHKIFIQIQFRTLKFRV